MLQPAGLCSFELFFNSLGEVTRMLVIPATGARIQTQVQRPNLCLFHCVLQRTKQHLRKRHNLQTQAVVVSVPLLPVGSESAALASRRHVPLRCTDKRIAV